MSSWRSRPLPADWSRTRRRILARDNDTCQHCGGGATHVDHIQPAAAGGSDEDENLQALCKACHARKTGREANLTRKTNKRPDEPHPGLRW